ncbi:SusC/RagA family TonB-linked outer membrane protein [Mucilaginibacter arboris]|uniref:SusC/RagA family TonB-linked outer membrane protein n=1 Tax=Mucilaginibacter arboris TaxID=2682090 RepID=A0A7K1STN9_9SPHI|nr:TonB-dependent receptor [Mucilaginibacter arboris]MVN20644.1 SusC/RagA family TonB-linked outer membrane protein [Mucilaginibacter arboris]
MKQKLLIFFLFAVFSLQAAFAQNRKITGTVTGADDGQPLPGVSVKVTGTNVGTQTDNQGTYSINVPANYRSLTFTYIGYSVRTIQIGNQSIMNIRLATSANALNEVVVTGYTTTSRDKSTGSVGKVTAASITDVPNGSFDQTLQGRVPGLSILAGSGQPGANANVYIRGYTSISGSTTPLYIIDGVPVESSVFATLNPNEFESIDVLKDAAATSLYGSRGANGVLVITTKRGKAGKTTFTYDVQGGFSDRTRTKFDMMSTQELLALQQSVHLGPGYTLSAANTNPVIVTMNGQRVTLTAAQKQHDLDSLGSINTRWDDIFFRRGAFQSHQLSASGGNENTRFYTSLSYYSQDGIAQRSNLNRYNARFNLDHTSGKFKMGLQSGLGYSQSNFTESEGTVTLANPYAAAYLGLPYENPYLANGSVATSLWSGQPTYPFPLFDSRTASNALARLNATTNRNNQIKETLGLNASYEFFKGFSVKTTLGIDFRETVLESSIYPNTYVGSTVSNGGQGSYSTTDQRNLQLIQTSGLQYNNTFGKHEIFATALAETIHNWYQTFNYTGYGINAALLNTPAGITAGTSTNGEIPAVGGSKTQNGINSLIGIARYTYNDRYTLQGSFRRDGSSQVVASNQYHNFFSISGNWNIKKEDFLSAISWIDVLRLRASYGTTATPFGTTGTSGNFGYLALYNAPSYAGTSGIAPSTPGNPNYNWEFTAQTNVGIDLNVLKNRLRIVADIYQKDTHNLFVQQNLSYTSGFASLQTNAGKMRNKGIEVSLEGDVLRGRDYVVTLFGNFAYNNNKITSLGQVSQFESGTSIIRVGLPLGSHYTVKSAGVDPQTGQYLYYNRDGSVTSVYSASTQNVAEFGTYLAPYQGGFGLNASYKGISLSSLFSYAQGFKRFNNQDYFLDNPANASSYNMEEIVNTIWRKPGDITTIGAITSQRQFNSNDVQDASFVRLRNVRLGYSLPKSLIDKIKYVSGVRVFAQGENLYTWTKWTGFDPEDNNNIASFEYPAARTFTFGLNVTL